MLRTLCAALAVLWGACVLLRSIPAGQVAKGGYTRRPASPAPRGLEWRKARRFGRRVVAVRLQVILC